MGGAELAAIQGKIAAHGAIRNLSNAISGKELTIRYGAHKRVKNFQAALWLHHLNRKQIERKTPAP